MIYKSGKFYAGVVVGAAIFAIIFLITEIFPKTPIYMEYGDVPECVEVIERYKKLSKPEVKLFGESISSKEGKSNITIVAFDKSKVVSGLVDATSKKASGCKIKLDNYWSAYLDAFVAFNNSNNLSLYQFVENHGDVKYKDISEELIDELKTTRIGIYNDDTGFTKDATRDNLKSCIANSHE